MLEKVILFLFLITLGGGIGYMIREKQDARIDQAAVEALKLKADSIREISAKAYKDQAEQAMKLDSVTSVLQKRAELVEQKVKLITGMAKLEPTKETVDSLVKYHEQQVGVFKEQIANLTKLNALKDSTIYQLHLDLVASQELNDTLIAQHEVDVTMRSQMKQDNCLIWKVTSGALALAAALK